jgi:hypothetical protein
MGILKMLFSKSLLGGSLYMALYRGNEGFANIAMFLIYLGTFAVCMLAISKDERLISKQRAAYSGKLGNVIYSMSTTISMVFILSMVYHDWIVTAIVNIIALIIGHSYRASVLKDA